MTTIDAREQVLGVFADHCRWLVEGRVDLLDAILDETFTAEHITGHVATKAEWLGQIAAGEFVYHRISPEHTSADVRDELATVTSRARYDVTIYGHRGHYRLATTLVYERDGGTWKAVRGASTTY